MGMRLCFGMGMRLCFGMGVRLCFGMGMRLCFGMGMRLCFGVGMRLCFDHGNEFPNIVHSLVLAFDHLLLQLYKDVHKVRELCCC